MPLLLQSCLIVVKVLIKVRVHFCGGCCAPGIGGSAGKYGVSTSPPVGVSQVSMDGASGLGGLADGVHLADAARCDVCYEGPPLCSLKVGGEGEDLEGDYVEILSLLPLEKCNLDTVKPVSKAVEKE